MPTIPFHNILFLDIETVSQFPAYDHLPGEWKLLWDTKSNALLKYHEGETNESLYPRAAIYAEFGKIICISCGILQGAAGGRKIILKSFFGENEKLLLQEFTDMLVKWSGGESKFLCAHNGKEFDFPYLCRRMIINGLRVPALLNASGKKPWEVNHLDTLELWKFGDFKNYTSLHLLACSLGIPTPKDDIDGSMVGTVYWSQDQPAEKEKNLQRIVTYCQKDVTAVAQIYLRMNGEDLIREENIEIKTA
jgi:3'-5' exonuclease